MPDQLLTAEMKPLACITRLITYKDVSSYVNCIIFSRNVYWELSIDNWYYEYMINELSKNDIQAGE
jgi:hypothetical protein